MNKLLWLVYPDFRVSNPYQDLLALALSDCGLNTRFGTITDALEATQSSPTVFHLHWEDTIYATASSENDARESVEAFLVELAVFREIGGLVVWTLHNAAPHEDAFPILSDRLRRSLAKQADIVHVHGSMASDLARRNGVSDERIILVPHPNIAPAYPNDIDDEAARRYFSIDHNETVFAFLGAVRSYKGVDMLLRAFAEVHRMQPKTQLILGGRQGKSQEGRYLMPSPGIRQIPHFVDDGIVQYVLRATDYVVLPYKRILTSGAVALALGFGRPVIIPDLPTLLEVVQPGREALVFRTGDHGDLVRAMLEACEHNWDYRVHLQEQALRTGQSVTFAHLATALLGCIHARQLMVGK